MARRQRFGVLGRVIVSIFCLLFASFGGFAMYMMAVDGADERESAGWEPAPCEVLDYRLSAKDEAYYPQVHFRYQWRGSSYESRTAATGDSGWDDAGELQRQIDAVADAGQCLVNPAQPTQAVLLKHSGQEWWAWFFLAPFVLVPLTIVVLMWTTFRDKKPTGSSLDEARDKNKSIGAGCFFGIFAIVGGFGVLFLLVIPLLRMWAVSGWMHVQADLHHAEVTVHTGDDSTSYGVFLLYSFERGGRTYYGGNWQLLGGSSGGRESKQQAVDQARRDDRNGVFKVWIDPDDPYSSVLDPGWPSTAWGGVACILFLAIGLGGMYGVRRAGRRYRDPDGIPGARVGRAARQDEVIGSAEAMGEEEGPVVLKASGGPMMRFVIALIIAGFWNGIVSIFAWQLFEDFDWFLAIFLSPFLLIGLVLFLAIPYTFLAFFNPRLGVEIAKGRLCLGDELRARYAFSRPPSKMREFKLYLIGEERATYRRGTRTYTDSAVFHSEEILSSEAGELEQDGFFDLLIPAESMHTLKTSNNEVRWYLRAHGDIPGFPDVSEQYPLTILPRNPEG